MRDIDYLFEGGVSTASPSIKTCSICGKRLSKYNTLGHCFHHPDPEQERKRLEREDRVAALAEKKFVQGMPTVPESTGMPVEIKEERLSEEKVIDVTCRTFETSREQIIRQGRQPVRVRARHILMYLLYTDTSLSYPAIGDLLDGRDHTTIIHGVSKITEELKTDSELQNLIHYLRSQYHSPSTEA